MASIRFLLIRERMPILKVALQLFPTSLRQFAHFVSRICTNGRLFKSCLPSLAHCEKRGQNIVGHQEARP